MQLYNKLSAQERAQMLEEAGTERLTLSFYKYAHIGNPQLFRDHLFTSLMKESTPNFRFLLRVLTNLKPIWTVFLF